MTYTRLNAEPATKKMKAYTNGWTTSITFYMHTGSQAFVMFGGSRLYGIWNNPTEIVLSSLSGTMGGITASRTGYPGNVTLSWTSNNPVAVLYIES